MANILLRVILSLEEAEAIQSVLAKDMISRLDWIPSEDPALSGPTAVYDAIEEARGNA